MIGVQGVQRGGALEDRLSLAAPRGGAAVQLAVARGGFLRERLLTLRRLPRFGQPPTRLVGQPLGALRARTMELRVALGHRTTLPLRPWFQKPSARVVTPAEPRLAV